MTNPSNDRPHDGAAPEAASPRPEVSPDVSPDVFPDVSDDTLREWQGIVDIMAELAGVPAALVMRREGPDIGVLVASDGPENPYTPGDTEPVDDSGLYCEEVMRSGDRLHVPDALADPDWADNPDIDLGMIAYLGYPIRLPDRTAFGTICILDRERNEFTATLDRLVRKFRDLIEHQLGLLAVSRALGAENASYRRQLEEIETLRGMLPMCAWCRSVRSTEGYWKSVEEYLDTHPDIVWTHGICPDCADGLSREASGSR